MPETSPKFHELQVAFATAKALIQDLPPHDIKTDDQQLRLRSFVLACHAAIEEYLEDLSAWVIRQCRSLYLESGIVPHPLLCLSSYYSCYEPMMVSVGPHSMRQLMLAMCDSAINKHETELAMVHGIKTKDQDAIFLPLGLRLHGFDPVLSQKLNALGETRGGFAHSFRIKQLSPRAAVEQNIRQIEQWILPFDNEMCSRIETRIY